MSAPIRISDREDGFDIHVDDDAVLGFFSIISAAKFQFERRSELLLSPWIQEIIEAMVRRSDRVSDLSNVVLHDSARRDVINIVKEYKDRHEDRRSIDHLLDIACYPFSKGVEEV